MAEGGLLDFFKSPEGQGLLAAGFGALAGRGTRAQAIGQGGLAGLLAYGRAGEMQADRERQNVIDQRQSQMFDWQKSAYEQQQAAQQRQQQQQAERNAYLSTIGQYKDDFSTQQNKFDPIKFMQLGGSPAEAEKLAGMGDWGRTAVDRTIESQDAQGNKITLQFDKFGRQVGDGVQGYIAPERVDLGGSVQFVRPQAGVSLKKTMTPGEQASNSLGWANNAISRQRLALDQNQAQQGKPEFRDGQWVVPPRDMKPGESRPVTAPTAVKDATEALALIKQARQILPNATGSYGGWLADQGARFFGASTPGAEASAKLKAIGGMLTSKMPKMSGPQSNADAALYAEMAGKVGDETLPIQTRMAALDTVEEIQLRHSGQGGGATGSFDATGQGGWSIRPK